MEFSYLCSNEQADLRFKVLCSFVMCLLRFVCSSHGTQSDRITNLYTAIFAVPSTAIWFKECYSVYGKVLPLLSSLSVLASAIKEAYTCSQLVNQRWIHNKIKIIELKMKNVNKIAVFIRLSLAFLSCWWSFVQLHSVFDTQKESAFGIVKKKSSGNPTKFQPTEKMCF